MARARPRARSRRRIARQADLAVQPEFQWMRGELGFLGNNTSTKTDVALWCYRLKTKCLTLDDMKKLLDASIL